MPEKRTLERARKARREGKAATTQAGEFVREEMEHVKRGKHGVKNPKQAIAIGLSKARRAGVDLKPPKSGVKRKTRQSAEAAYRKGQKSGALRGKRSQTKGSRRTGSSRSSSRTKRRSR